MGWLGDLYHQWWLAVTKTPQVCQSVHQQRWGHGRLQSVLVYVGMHLTLWYDWRSIREWESQRIPPLCSSCSVLLTQEVLLLSAPCSAAFRRAVQFTRLLHACTSSAFEITSPKVTRFLAASYIEVHMFSNSWNHFLCLSSHLNKNFEYILSDVFSLSLFKTTTP